MAKINYYFPKISYEQELERRHEQFQCSNIIGLDKSTGIKHSKMMGWDIYTHEDIPNDFDITKYEIVHSEIDNSINNIDDFERMAQNQNHSNITNSSCNTRREFRNGDIVEIDGLKYYCLTVGWKQV